MIRNAFCLILATLVSVAQADITIDISGTGGQQTPVAIANFAGEVALQQTLTPIIRADLDRSGRFKLIDPSGATLTADGAPPDLASWKTKGADSLAVGDVRTTSDGSVDVRVRLYDTVTLKLITGVQVHGRAGDMRRVSHQIADVIYEALTGERGVFSTQIAYVLKQGRHYSLQVADADGNNAVAVAESNEPITSPAWASDGRHIAYVTYGTQKPVVRVQDVFSGKSHNVADFKGSNSSPAFSPDGGTMAVTLSLSGASQIYLIDTGGGQPRRLMQSPGIDTEANFSPDGHSIAFTSDRGGSPQVYMVPSIGGNAQRLTFDGNYNVTPRFAPDGKSLVYIRRAESGYTVATLDLASRQTTVLSDGPDDQSPSFAPNGKLIIYETQVGGRGVLAIVSSDGRVHQRLSAQGDVRDPVWGPFPSQLQMTRLSSNP